MIRISDLLAVEQEFDEAQNALRQLREPRSMSGHESLTRDGRRELNISDIHLQRMEQAQAKVERAAEQLLTVRRQFIAEAS